MDFFNEKNKKQFELFVKKCMEKDIMEVKRRIHRVWDAQEEMVLNNLMLLNNIEERLKGGGRLNVLRSDNNRPEMLENFLTLEQSFAELKCICPNAFSIWIDLFNNGKEEYISDPIHNMAIKGNPFDKAFDNFGKLYLDKPGYLLDIGCGPQALPYYLRDFPIEFIYGIDPLPPFERHPFKFTQNIAEFIPYKDESFDYIVSVTSLDHVLLLDRALDEMNRVLKVGGVLLIWANTGGDYAENPEDNVNKYDPYKENIRAVDKYHMFHIGLKWFEAMMEHEWDKESHYSDRYNNHFYAFRKKDNKSAEESVIGKNIDF